MGDCAALRKGEIKKSAEKLIRTKIEKLIEVQQMPAFINVDEHGVLSFMGHGRPGGGFVDYLVSTHGLEIKKMAKRYAR